MTKLCFIVFLFIPFIGYSGTPAKKDDRFFKTVDELVQAIITHNDNTDNPDEIIDSFRAYRNNYRLLEKAPASPAEYYEGEWVNWRDLIRRINLHFFDTPLELKEAIAFHNMMNPDKQIVNSETYLKYYKLLKRAPYNPRKYYKKAWKGWWYVLGQKPKIFIKKLSILQEKVQAHNKKYPLRQIKSQSTYGLFYKDIEGAPANPDKFYSDWVSWPVFLEKQKLSFEAFIKAIIEHNMMYPDEQINSDKTYKEHYKSIPGAPSNPARTYKGQWKGWGFVSEQCEKAFLEAS